jgi:serine phosphatase RsbU (regulator of sigma subunit)
VTTGARPAALLQQTDQALRTLRSDAIATVLVARLEPLEDRADGARLRWASAGHPPPMLVEPDGAVTVLSVGRPDPLLGVVPVRERKEADLLLPAGSTVVLYTDGLVERRDQRLRAGIERLRETLSELAGLELADLCDEVVARMLPEHPGDDVALVAVRLRP